MKRLLTSAALITAALGACGDNAKPGDPDAGAVDAAPKPDAMPEPDAGPDGPKPPSPVGLVVVNSDYKTVSSLSILAADGTVTRPDCLHSGSTPPGNTLALSGDVTLPSAPQPDNPIVAVDRGNSALTWVDPADCAPSRQLDVSTKFYANPHDVVGIRRGKAYVTRYERNGNPSANPDDLDEGDDLLIIDPSAPAITGRIDLSAYAVPVAGARMQARPDRAILAAGTVYVSLGNISGDFAHTATGRLVLIDPGTDKIKGVIDLTGLKNCGTGLSYVEATHTLVVTCVGAYEDGFTQMDHAGVIFIDAAASPPVETRRVMASTFGRVLGAYAASRDGALGFGITYGAGKGKQPPDQLWILDVKAGSVRKLADGVESFTYPGLFLDHTRQRAYLTDGNPAEPRLRVYDYSNPAAPSLATSINASPDKNLPPREIQPY